MLVDKDYVIACINLRVLDTPYMTGGTVGRLIERTIRRILVCDGLRHSPFVFCYVFLSLYYKKYGKIDQKTIHKIQKTVELNVIRTLII